jgi:CubicO group peptidase (beta-lactamase class C family)
MNGELDGHRLLKPETIDLMLTEQFYDTDLVVGEPIRFGFGMGLNSREFPCPSDSSVHWGGAGGSIMVADSQYRASIGYAMNFMRGDFLEDPRTAPMRKAFKEILQGG